MHGFLVVNKPCGPSSTYVTNQLRRSFATKVKAGHSGTLDPLASGVLVIAINAATRFIPYLRPYKKYGVSFTLGITTDTYDREGTVTKECPVPDDYLEQLTALLPEFVGTITQQAPAYSALKHQGKPLYALARQGKEVPPKIRQVEIMALTNLAASGTEVSLEVECGPGCYIRSLVHDLGQRLGCGAVLTALTRTQCGNADIATAFIPPVDDVEAQLIDVDKLLDHLPALRLPAADITRLHHGQALKPQFAADGVVRIYDSQDEFIGLGRQDDAGFTSVRLLPPAVAVC